ncbi:MAG: TraI domain-containing protein [gamma proteobacterium symbiont of Lucinoma myriamae]|nr:TraI domain-containing protein [gamma proteobacterium symbiont of Lucinoma myriamae]MCU7832075.1 TraI domain-containing protein [gamma proteobacterium symbiont of Lucinoma myriamae]
MFSAALLHDIGKTLALVQITLTNKEGHTSSWSPYLGKMPSSTRSYQITFQPADYHLHHQLSISLMDILPRQARHWLLLDKRLIKQLMAWLMSDPYECGIIGEIVRKADMESTAADLKLGGHKVRFPGTFHLPMIDRLMTALRHLLNDGILKLNRNGASGWIYQGKAYLVCRTVANAVQHYLQENGATDIPTEPTRLYDTWQEHGYAQDNPDGGAIWKIAINGEDYQLNLTVMIFTASQLFRVGHIPREMKGSIEILSQNTNIKELSQSPNTQTPHETVSTNTAEPTGSDTDTQSNQPINNADPFDLSNDQSTETSSAQIQEPVTTKNTSAELETSPEPGDLYTPTQQKTATADLSESNNEKTEAVPTSRNLAQNNLEQPSNSGAVPHDNASIPAPSEREVGEYFIQWVRRSVRDKSLKVNQVKAQVHVIAKGVILISPVIIKKFCSKMGYDEMTSGKPTWKIVQAHFHKCKLHIKTDNHVNIHKFQVKGPNRSTFLNGYLLPFEVIYPDGKHPEFNKVITHVG